MPNVKVIPAQDTKPVVLRVAAYCRVSSDSSDQLHSYATQIRAYTDLIQQHTNWELVDIYADEGLTGTRVDKREDFQRMMADCRRGKIDRILVKSVSRFARNTKDCLVALRELSGLGVTVLFEEDHIDTETLTTEFLVSVFGALAQQESISISQNQRMSYQRRMEKGEFSTCVAPCGYQLVDKKRLEIDPDEVETVRWIFERYLAGDSEETIAAALTESEKLTSIGNSRWHHNGIKYILLNEKYVGDSLCQKYYTPPSLPFVKRKNHGEAAQYYVENSHAPIISREVFQRAKNVRQLRQRKAVQAYGSYPLHKKIVCGQCGTGYGRRASQKGYVTWVCQKHDEKAALCSNGRIPESEIYGAFVRMYNKLKLHSDVLFPPAKRQLEELAEALQRDNTSVLSLNQQIADIAEQSHRLSVLHSKGVLDDAVFQTKHRTLDTQLGDLRKQRRKLLYNESVEQGTQKLQEIMDILQNGPDHLVAFDAELFETLVEKITAESNTVLGFRLHGGIELREQIREVRRR